MASDRQNAANKINAQKSTGPNSDKGKAVSSQNALKSGIDSKCEVIRFESRDEYETLTTEFHARFRPATPEERFLVDALVRNEWFSRRYMCVEAGIWTREFNSTDHGAIGTAFIRHADHFCKVDRRLNSAQRNFQRALTQLTDLQARRKETVDETEPLNPKLASFRAFPPDEQPPLAA